MTTFLYKMAMLESYIQIKIFIFNDKHPPPLLKNNTTAVKQKR